MMDEYRKGWALRYLREAKAELEAARKMPYMAPSLVLESIRKARNAIYYSLGEPAFIEVLIREEAGKARPTNDTGYRPGLRRYGRVRLTGAGVPATVSGCASRS